MFFTLKLNGSPFLGLSIQRSKSCDCDFWTKSKMQGFILSVSVFSSSIEAHFLL